MPVAMFRTATAARRLALAAFAVLIFSTGAADTARAGKRVALVIGNTMYRSVPSLPNTGNDAKAMAALFTSAGFDVVQSRYDLGVLDFKRTLREFMGMARDADIAVVYYAGHGVEVKGTNYLIPVDAKLARDYDVEDEAIPLDRILSSIEQARTLRLVILDACRDNPFLGKMQRTVSMRAVVNGLATVEPPTGSTLVAYAAKAGSVAADGAGRHSPFTTALLNHITEPGLDVRIAFGRVRDEVLRVTANAQEPFVYGSLGGTTVSLVPAPAAPPVPVVSIRDQQRDYELAERVGTVAGFETFLARNATGFYAELARAQIAKLTERAGQGRAEPPRVVSAKPADPVDAAAEALRQRREAQRAREQAALQTPVAPAPVPPAATPSPVASVPRAEPAGAATNAEQSCRRDRDRLARLRSDPVAEEVLRFERELACEPLRAQVARLRESVVGPVAAPALAAQAARPVSVPTGPVPTAAAPSVATPPPALAAKSAAAPSSAAVSADACRRDQETLARLRADPTREGIARLERELRCETLRPQVVRLRESVAD
ncbi:caspase family protein [Rhodoplanes sp.]|uniref:caspase family protein n=1 Tax=Rhodoplanes sp. TaxID=1968906 RepID=UPI0025FE31D5|nr:caspase family protein [Rhodoplanes sp.]